MSDVEICIEILKETENAYFITNGDGIEEWIPKSQISSQSREENCSIMNIPEWLALEKGMI